MWAGTRGQRASYSWQFTLFKFSWIETFCSKKKRDFPREIIAREKTY
jgi:hypothetical protein